MPNQNEKNPFLGLKVEPTPKRAKEIGIDTNDTLQKEIIDATIKSTLDISALEGFGNVSQTRETVYSLIDTMAQDSTISAVLETYTEDITQPNDEGKIIWCESQDRDVLQYVSFLLEDLNINKNIFTWTYNLIKYGDIYLRMYRESDYSKDLLFDEKNALRRDLNEKLDKAKKVDESVNLNIYADNDHYVHYVEMISNPCEMFELTKLGKTVGYVQAPSTVSRTYTTTNQLNPYLTSYKMRDKDIEIYSAADFVHGCIDTSSNRNPETVDIFSNEENKQDETLGSYSVRRGQSILYNSFKVWRELTLLENSVLLNRITRSSIVRILSVEVGNMPKEQVRLTLEKLKANIEQKTAISKENGMQEYTNPGPVENIIYVPTRNQIGNVNATTLGDGQVDVKQLPDLEYWRDKMFANLKIPKQFMGMTNDSTGFNGGTSLTLISSRYGKTIKRYQTTIRQMITDIVNLLLIDKGLTSYVNKFVIKMQEPVTQEEKDKREAMNNKVRYIQDTMGQLNDLPDTSAKLKILKSLLGTTITDSEVFNVLDAQIKKLEAEESGGKVNPTENENKDRNKTNEEGGGAETSPNKNPFADFNKEVFQEEEPTTSNETSAEETTPTEETQSNNNEEEEKLPSFDELGINGTRNV